MRWTTEQYREYQARQLPLGRDTVGLDKPKRINTSAPEWTEAERLIRWAHGDGAELYPELRWFHSIPNGGFRHKVVAAKMKAQGVLAGVPDFYLDVARGSYHGLRIELKRRVGGQVSDPQKLWIAWLNNQGYLAVVCKGWEDARDRLVGYLSMRNDNESPSN